MIGAHATGTASTQTVACAVLQDACASAHASLSTAKTAPPTIRSSSVFDFGVSYSA